MVPSSTARARQHYSALVLVVLDALVAARGLERAHELLQRPDLLLQRGLPRLLFLCKSSAQSFDLCSPLLQLRFARIDLRLPLLFLLLPRSDLRRRERMIPMVTMGI